jgi:serine/threonine-protein kinase
VHRDVKPETVLLTADFRVKVVDFGLARTQATPGHTSTNVIIGTVAYLAPEQVHGTATDARTDVYSAGVLLFELLTGTQPHQGDSPLAVAYKHVNAEVPPPSTLLPGIPPVLDRLVTTATNRDPELRMAGADQFLRAISEARRDMSYGAPAGTAEPWRELADIPPPQTMSPALTDPYATGEFRATGYETGGYDTNGYRSIEPQLGEPRQSQPRHSEPRNSAPRNNGHRASSHRANGNQAPVSHDPGYDLPPVNYAAFNEQGRPPGPAAPGSHTLVVSRDDIGYPHEREPFLQRWLFSRRLGYLAVALVVVAALGTGGWWLTSGRYKTVPQVAGETVTTATAALTNAGFSVATGSLEASNTVARGLVAATSPAGRATKGSKVMLLVSSGPVMITVPPVTSGGSLSAAKAAVKNARLSYTIKYVLSDSIALGQVVGTNPIAGTSWPQPRPVTIRVSGLPDFTGQTQQVAQQWANQYHITLNMKNQNSNQAPQGTIISQSPGASAATPGETVTIVVSSGPAIAQVPPVVGDPVAQAEQILRQHGFRVTLAQGGFDHTGTVLRESPSGQAPEGSTITIDDQLIG